MPRLKFDRQLGRLESAKTHLSTSWSYRNVFQKTYSGCEVTPTAAMTVKIVVEVLSTLAIATKEQIK